MATCRFRSRPPRVRHARRRRLRAPVHRRASRDHQDLQERSLLTMPFLDISSKVLSGGEQGLLSVAFHPQYRSNRRFFVNYTASGGGAAGKSVIAEYLASATNPDVADPTERVLLEINQPFSNHNGGLNLFGPDGYLYIGLGDGGSGGDPQNNGQSLGTLLGKVL